MKYPALARLGIPYCVTTNTTCRTLSSATKIRRRIKEDVHLLPFGELLLQIVHIVAVRIFRLLNYETLVACVGTYVHASQPKHQNK